MASEPLSKEERAERVKYAKIACVQNAAGTARLSDYPGYVLRYEATVVACEERIAELEQRLVEVTNSDDRDAQVMQKNRRIVDLKRDIMASRQREAKLCGLVNPLRDIASRDPDLWGLTNAMLTSRKALASIGEWDGKYDDSILRRAEEWDARATNESHLREAAEAAAEYLELSGHEPSDSPILVQLREALKT